MTNHPNPRKLATVGAVLGVLATAGLAVTPTSRAAAAEPAEDLSGLKVLLTNDDSAQGHDAQFGSDGKGLYEMRKALCAAGADVLVVSPWSQQSGASARITPPGFRPVPLTVEPVVAPPAYAEDCGSAASGGAVFGVCVSDQPCEEDAPSASPSDAVTVALSRFAATRWEDGPDVVVVGSNFGHNVGTTVNHSGTVGAAVTAREHGVPAVAFSTEVPLNLAQIPLMPFAETADFAVGLLSAMMARHQLRPGVALNVNHPFVGDGETLGRPVLAATGTSDPLGAELLGDVDADGGTYQLVAGQPTPETERRADTTALVDNDIPITPLDGDWGDDRRRVRLMGLLAALR